MQIYFVLDRDPCGTINFGRIAYQRGLKGQATVVQLRERSLLRARTPEALIFYLLVPVREPIKLRLVIEQLACCE